MEVSDFLKSNTTTITDPSEGMLLLSAPMMFDNYFTRSAVLILARDTDGSHLGLILNHCIEIDLREVMKDENVDLDLPLYKIPVFNGGPVDLNRNFLLHRFGDRVDGSIEILPGLYTGGDSAQLLDIIDSGEVKEGDMRLFFGISGWAPNQLTKEILENSWAVNPAPDPKLLLTGKGDEFWRREVKNLGEEYRSWLSMPIHPSFN